MQKLLLMIILIFASNAWALSKNLILIGNPRSATTAFERYMIKRGDYDIYHEPISIQGWLYALGIKTLGRDFTGKDYGGGETLISIDESLRKRPYFIKEMAFFLQDNQTLLDLIKHNKIQVIFLIRNPEQAVLSHYKLTRTREINTHFGGTVNEMRYDMMEKLFFKIMQLTGTTPLLIDADELITHPQQVLSKLCNKLQISFDPQDLVWEAGEKNYWSNTAHAWQLEVTNSTGFIASNRVHSLDEVALEDRQAISKLIGNNLDIYNKLIQYKMALD